jgi:hypothetical protein
LFSSWSKRGLFLPALGGTLPFEMALPAISEYPMITLKKLPFSDLPFAKIISNDYLYADKTRYVYELVQEPVAAYFLSRPRRFGKTTLLDTFRELFSGNLELFKGLWIDKSGYTFLKHPVIHLSLAMDVDNPDMLREGLMANLKKIARKENLKIPETQLAVYFQFLIEELYLQRNKTGVVVLIDEYDAPVTREMANKEIAQANADVLHNFFATLKTVRDYLRFTFVTGITRYALTSMDSGANHLTDISLDPKYAGLCGFTLEEFDTYFADWMEEALPIIRDEKKIMKSSASLADLRAEILAWYDGYNWGGETRVLNPYSILNLFKESDFGNYWIQSGRPRHLTALIQSRPLDFYQPKLDSYLSEEVRKSALNNLAPVPVLFHSGYLTLDKISRVTVPDSTPGKTKKVKSYSFRLPNFEVFSSYNEDCFQVVFNLKSSEDLKPIGEELLKALSAMDAALVSDIFSKCFSTVSYLQRPRDERAFHGIIQMLLTGMGFKVFTELLGADNRLDLCVELPNGDYVIIELKYVKGHRDLKPEEKIKVLATAAKKQFTKEELNKCFANLAVEKLPTKETYTIEILNDETERNRLLAELAVKSLTNLDLDQALAELVNNELPKEMLTDILLSASPMLKQSDEQIEDKLSQAVAKALKAIKEKNYHGIVALKAKNIIDLGLAIYGVGSKVKAAFGNESKPTKSHNIPRSRIKKES